MAGPRRATPGRRSRGDAQGRPGPLAAAAAPLLQILARLANAGVTGQPPVEELRERSLRALRAFEADARDLGSPAEEIRAAHYVLCAALDDVVLSMPWGAQSSWAQKSLVSTFHQETRSGERVFDLLTGMQKDPGRYKGALEVAYLALSLGLQGKYRLMPRGVAELDRVREGLFGLLATLRGNWERELSPHWRGVDAPHRGQSRSVPAWVAFALAAALLGGGWYWLSDNLGASAGNLYERMAQLPPGVPPSIDRTAPPVPPAPPPPPPANAPPRPDATTTLRRFLAPEIAQGLVTVEGDAQRLLVRIRNRGMFPSGSATLDGRFNDLLRRIGEGLKEEPGRVQVQGHSDNQPIRTVRFPSNFALSLARAESAMAAIVAANGTRRASRRRVGRMPSLWPPTPRPRAARKTGASRSFCCGGHADAGVRFNPGTGRAAGRAAAGRGHLAVRPAAGRCVRRGLAARVLCAVPVLLWAIIVFLIGRRRESRDAGLVEAAAAPDPQAAKNEAAAEEEAALREKLTDALGKLKTATGGKGTYLYDLPWYAIIGPPGSGKTTALLNSGLEFPLAEGRVAGVGGTRFCDWWLTDRAVMIDTAGRYTTQDSDADADRAGWERFLDLLKKNRPKQPLNGVLVAFGVDMLSRLDAQAREGHARQYAAASRSWRPALDSACRSISCDEIRSAARLHRILR